LLRPVPEGDELDAEESDVLDDEGVNDGPADDEAEEVENLFSSLAVKL